MLITLLMAQQLKTNNINVVPGQLSCCQCKGKFLVEKDSLHSSKPLPPLAPPPPPLPF